ncbi:MULTISPECIES: hypothetical protein [unclassified Bradyrhizobium]
MSIGIPENAVTALMMAAPRRADRAQCRANDREKLAYKIEKRLRKRFRMP